MRIFAQGTQAFSRNLALWSKAIRVPFFTATITPVALGATMAWHDQDHFVWSRFFLTMVGALLMHAGTNLANDYFDHRSGCDQANQTPTPFSGGSRVIQDGLVAPKKMLSAALAAFLLGSGIGLYLNYLSGQNTILILGIFGVFLGFFYTAKPLQIGYGSFGELATGVGFGPLMVMGSYYVQAQRLPFEVFFVSLPVGILVALVLFINEFPDYDADKSVNKKTLVVILGKKQAVQLYHILLAIAYLLIALLILFRFLPLASLMVFLTLPLAFKAYGISKQNFDKIYELLSVNAATIGLHFLIGLMLCAGFFLDKVL